MTRRVGIRSIALGLAMACAAPPSIQAAELAPGGFVSEMKLGVGLHDIGLFGDHKENGINVNGEVLFHSPGFLSFLFAPRPHLGVQWNAAGNTSQLYGGLTWQYDFDAGLFLAGSLGLSLHDGKLDTDQPDRKSLGTRVLFRESLEVGYRFGERRRHAVSIMAAHISNAWLADENEGLDTITLRYGYRF